MAEEVNHKSERFHPLVSIVIPVYNGSNYMREAIDSALSQTYDNIEVIVVNDGSTDDTEAIALSYGDRIRYYAKENGGVASALNLAIREAKGEYISWLSHDDIYYPDKVKKQIYVLSGLANKKTIIYSNWEYIDTKSVSFAVEKLHEKHGKPQLGMSLYPLLNGIINGCSLLISRSIYLELGLFKTQLRTTQDYDLFFDILRKYPIRHIENILLKTRDHCEQGSKSLASIHVPESDTLWNRIIESLTEGEIAGLSDSSFDFYMTLTSRLRHIGCFNAANAALKRALPVNNGKRNTLFTTANMAGGLGRYSQEFTEALSIEFNVFILLCQGREICLQYRGKTIMQWQMSKAVLFDDMFTTSRLDIILGFILQAFEIDIVHINGFLLFGFTFLDKVKQFGLPVLYVVHDFQLICVSQHLVNGNGNFCNTCSLGNENQRCLEGNYFSDMFGELNAKKLHKYRTFIKTNVLNKIDCFIYPSESCKKRLQDFYPELTEKNSMIVPHGIKIDSKLPTSHSRVVDKRIRVGIIGSIDRHKGLLFLRNITSSLSQDDYIFILFGTVATAFKNTVDMGRYDYREIIGKLQKADVDVMLILSDLPETYSYTVSECLCARIPLIVSNYGAQAERVLRDDCGWIVGPNNIAEKVVELLQHLRKNPSELFEKKRKMSSVSVDTIDRMCSSYVSIYRLLMNSCSKSNSYSVGNVESMLAFVDATFSDVLQISDNDLVGNKFNGHDLHLYLKSIGVDSKQLVWNKQSNDDDTFVIARERVDRLDSFYLSQSLQKKYFLNSLLNPIGYDILYDPLFLNARIIHLHLVYNGLLDIQLLPLMSQIKPIVWTLHDPWALSGHCIEHGYCEKWKTGCGDCPQLTVPFELNQDTTALNYEIKRQAIQASNISVVVASKFMLNKVKQSPLFSGKKVWLIPFGIDQNIFKKTDKADCRKRLRIPSEAIVIAFRSDNRYKKGVDYVEHVIQNLQSRKKVYFIAIGGGEYIKNSRFRYIDYAWINDDRLMAEIYNASDIFLMPSTLESFGMMAIEAMSCGTLPIVIDGTALSETINAPECGASTKRNKSAYLEVVQYFLDYPDKRAERGLRCLEYAKERYCKDIYLKKLIKVYTKASETHKLSDAHFKLLQQLKKYMVTDHGIIKNTVREKSTLPDSEVHDVICERQSMTSSNKSKIRKVLWKAYWYVSPTFRMLVGTRERLKCIHEEVIAFEKRVLSENSSLLGRVEAIEGAAVEDLRREIRKEYLASSYETNVNVRGEKIYFPSQPTTRNTDYYDCSLEEFFDLMKKVILKTDTVLDVGSGIRPQSFFVPRVHICIEPFEQYRHILKPFLSNDTHYVLLRGDALSTIASFDDDSVDTIFMIDLIEHLEKQDGKKLLIEAERVARKQIIVFTPYGFYPMSFKEDGQKDAWGLDGVDVQEHKSGWLPEDFDETWDCYVCVGCHEAFLSDEKKIGKRYDALMAVRTKKFTGFPLIENTPEFVISEYERRNIDV